MIYVLDSNIISYMLKGNLAVIEHYRRQDTMNHEFIIPPIVVYEVRRGLLAKKLYKRLEAFEQLCHKIQYMDFDKTVWQEAAQIYALLRQKGILIDDADIFIAAFCMVNNYTLVTGNVRHFSHVHGLNYVNWT